MNPIIEKTQQALLAKADPRLKPAIMRAVEAGKTVMFSPESRRMFLDALKEATDPHAIGSGVAKLMALLIHKSGGKMPPQVAVPAALLLLCEVLQFMEDAGDLKVDNDLMAECTSSTGSAMLQALGVTPEKLQALKAKQGGIVSNAMGAA